MEIVKEKYIKLTVLEKQKYIKLIKDKFERELAKRLHLPRVSAPLFVTKESGLQDDLSGVERKVKFDLLKDGKEIEGKYHEVSELETLNSMVPIWKKKKI